MSFWEFVVKLSNSGTVGSILATIVIIAAGAWWVSVFMLPFCISHIRNDVAKIRDDVERLKRGVENK